MKKLLVEMKIIADRVVHHMPEAFFDLQVFLSANMAERPLQGGAAVQAISFFSVMFFHSLVLTRFVILIGAQIFSSGMLYFVCQSWCMFIFEYKGKYYRNY